MDLKLNNNSKLKALGKIRQLEYLESSGTQYIDTKISCINGFRAIIDLSVLTQTSGYAEIVGCASDANHHCVFRSQNQHWSPCLHNDYTSTYNTFNFSEKYNIDVDFRNNTIKLTVNDKALESGKGVSGTYLTSSIFLFTANNGNGVPRDFAGTQRIYSAKIYDANKLVRDFVPVLDNNDTPCMYDVLSGTFFYTQSREDFIAGPIVGLVSTNLLPHNILLKTTTFYHKNTPNVSFINVVFSILNYQKNHQDEIKEYYYPTTKLWQDIITEYPDIVQYYNMNHKLCVAICDADDPEQFTEDFLQAIEDSPDIVDVFADYPDMILIVAGNPSLAPIVAKNPEVVHSLIDTGYIAYITNTSGAYIDTGKNPANPKISIKFREKTSAHDFDYFGNSDIDGSFICCDIEWTKLRFLRWGSSQSIDTNIDCPVNTFNKLEFSGNLIIKLNDTIAYQGTHVYTKSNSQTNIVVFKSGRGNDSVYDLSEFIIEDGVDKLWLVPIQNNSNPCMIDLLTGTKYLNQGTGTFTYSLEPKTA